MPASLRPLRAHFLPSGSQDSRQGLPPGQAPLFSAGLSLPVTHTQAEKAHGAAQRLLHKRSGNKETQEVVPGASRISISMQAPSRGTWRLGLCKANYSFHSGTSPKPTKKGGHDILFAVLCVKTVSALSSSGYFSKFFPSGCPWCLQA